VIVVIALIAGAVALYLWDSSKRDQIAKGITVGGVDVGGLKTDEAHRLLRRDLQDPLQKPVKVTFRGRTHKLSPERIDARVDIDGSVEQAKSASRDDLLPVRAWRYATGGKVNRSLDPRIAYSQRAVDRFVKSTSKKIDRPARDASIKPSGQTIQPTRARVGFLVRRADLRTKVEDALQRPEERTVRARVRRTHPKVRTRDLAAKYPTYITIDRSAFKLRFYKRLKLAKTYTIAVGQVGFDTPAGLYHIENKQHNAAWSVPNSDWAGDLAGTVIPGGAPNNPLKARWMGIVDGAGIHGTAETGSLGTAASHGCIRMDIPDVIELYDQVPVRTPVYIG
jgi:lipoprotein-anchoring transpeptidase ErfK/SrfK